MEQNNQFFKGDKVKFTKKIIVFDESKSTQFFAEPGMTAEVVEDNDAGPIGSIVLRVKKEDGSEIIVEANDQFLEKIE